MYIVNWKLLWCRQRNLYNNILSGHASSNYFTMAENHSELEIVQVAHQVMIDGDRARRLLELAVVKDRKK